MVGFRHNVDKKLDKHTQYDICNFKIFIMYKYIITYMYSHANVQCIYNEPKYSEYSFNVLLTFPVEYLHSESV